MSIETINQFEDKCKQHFSRRCIRHPEPQGAIIQDNLNALAKDIHTLAGVTFFHSLAYDKPVTRARKCIIIDAKNISNIPTIAAKMVFIISPRDLVVDRITATHVVVIGGNITINHLECQFFTALGMKKLVLGAVDIYQSAAIIGDQLITKTSYMALRSYITCNEWKAPGYINPKAFIVAGIADFNYNNIKEKDTLFRDLPDLYIADYETGIETGAFKCAPYLICSRIYLFMYNLFGIEPGRLDPEEKDKDHPYFTCQEVKIDPTYPPYINLVNFFKMRMLYQWVIDKQNSIPLGEDMQEASPKERTVSGLDLLPLYIRADYGIFRLNPIDNYDVLTKIDVDF